GGGVGGGGLHKGGEGGRQIKMGRGVEQCLLIALGGDADQKRPKVAQPRLRSKPVVDENLVAPAGRKLAPYDQFIAIDFDTGGFKHFVQFRHHLQREKPLDKSVGLACFQHL